jgi:archaemetzincin
MLLGILVAVVAFGASDAAPRKCVIALVPVGDAPPKEAAALAPTLAESFGCQIEIAPAVPMPSSAWNATRRQYLSTDILDALAGRKRPEWERLLGIADEDLYVPELNFVFGEGDARRGVAVFSLARLHGEEALFRKRAATEAVHELGHTYGLSHCDDPHCVMWFSNTLAETDRKGTRFCFRHAKELAHSRPAPPRATS